MEAKFAFIYQLQITHPPQKKKKNICVGIKFNIKTRFIPNALIHETRWDTNICPYFNMSCVLMH